MRSARPDPAPPPYLAPLGPRSGPRAVRPGTRGAPSPARSLCSRRHGPRGPKRGEGGGEAPAGPRRLLCSRPRPPALPRPPRVPRGEQRRCWAAPRGARGPRGRCPEARALPPQTRPRYPKAFFKEEPRCEESLRWVGAFYTKPAAVIGRPGAGTAPRGGFPPILAARLPARPGSAASGGPARNRARPGRGGWGPRDPSASCRSRLLTILCGAGGEGLTGCRWGEASGSSGGAVA